MPGILLMTATISSPFCFESFRSVAVDLDREFAFHAADGFFHVVGDRLREIPDRRPGISPARGSWLRSALSLS